MSMTTISKARLQRLEAIEAAAEALVKERARKVTDFGALRRAHQALDLAVLPAAPMVGRKVGAMRLPYID